MPEDEPSDADGEAAEMEDEEAEMADEVRQKPAPRNKSELYRAYSGAGPVDMFNEFLQDRTLQLHAIIICFVADPLENDYSASLEAQKGGPGSMTEWAARRADGASAWLRTVALILLVLHGRTLFARLGMAPSGDQPIPHEFRPAWLEDERSLLAVVFKFVVALSSNVYWSQVMFALCLPHALAILLHPVRAKRVGGMARLKLCGIR
jgi:hypothetical protein